MQQDSVIIHRSTLINNFTQRTYFDTELVKHTAGGEARSTASLVNPGDRSALIIATVSHHFGNPLVGTFEIRKITENGTAHTQVIVFFAWSGLDNSTIVDMRDVEHALRPFRAGDPRRKR